MSPSPPTNYPADFFFLTSFFFILNLAAPASIHAQSHAKCDDCAFYIRSEIRIQHFERLSQFIMIQPGSQMCSSTAKSPKDFLFTGRVGFWTMPSPARLDGYFLRAHAASPLRKIIPGPFCPQSPPRRVQRQLREHSGIQDRSFRRQPFRPRSLQRLAASAPTCCYPRQASILAQEPV